MTVGDRIRQVRIEKDITQQELADCAGVSEQAVYKYENNMPDKQKQPLSHYFDYFFITRYMQFILHGTITVCTIFGKTKIIMSHYHI